METTEALVMCSAADDDLSGVTNGKCDACGLGMEWHHIIAG